MWIAKIKFSEEGTLIGSRAKKYKINIFGFPLSYYYQKNYVIVHITGTIFGEKENKKGFLKELSKDKRVIEFEEYNDFLIGIIKEPIYSKHLYNKDIIHLAPALISDEGYEIITIGSFKKEKVMKAFNYLEKTLGGDLISIQNKKIKAISVMKISPELTENQRKAMHLAIKQGYYKSPRKISIQNLAKLSNLSFSTFQVHLRKAEGKLIPYFFE